GCLALAFVPNSRRHAAARSTRRLRGDHRRRGRAHHERAAQTPIGFLLELGTGFAFVGRQVRLEVGDQDFYVDLLFYHLKLRSYVVVELKAVAFDPAFVGQLNVYLSAADDLLRHPDDKPSIGLLLCRSKTELVVEYALRDLKKPIGVASGKRGSSRACRRS
ncbi:MAG: PDDEXK nuclease domain-containing protein, partial [Myxococcaceae bacterium]